MGVGNQLTTARQNSREGNRAVKMLLNSDRIIFPPSYILRKKIIPRIIPIDRKLERKMENIKKKSVLLADLIGRGEEKEIKDEKLLKAVLFVEERMGRDLDSRIYISRESGFMNFFRWRKVLTDGATFMRLRNNASIEKFVYRFSEAKYLIDVSRKIAPGEKEMINLLNIYIYDRAVGWGKLMQHLYEKNGKGAEIRFGTGDFFKDRSFYTAVASSLLVAGAVVFEFSPMLREWLNSIPVRLDSLSDLLGFENASALIKEYAKPIINVSNIVVRYFSIKYLAYALAAISIKNAAEWRAYITALRNAKKSDIDNALFQAETVPKKLVERINDVFLGIRAGILGQDSAFTRKKSNFELPD